LAHIIKQEHEMTDDGMDRRDFLKSAAATFALLMTSEGLSSAQVPNKKAVSKGLSVKIGVIGLGQWGKEIVSTLSKLPSVQVTAICDTYANYVTRASKIAPKAKTFVDYRQLLESPDVEAVVIATPTHQHKEIALAAIEAEKHVYCEAPLSNTIEEARAIAQAGQDSKNVFQTGLQGRSNLLYNHVSRFVKSGCLGTLAEVHSQWNKRQSWRRAAPNPEREKELNWRLFNVTSLGLVGESGIHSLDLTNWYLRALPISVTGFGSIMGWDDGRDVPDTIQCVFEYPNNVRMVFSSTLVSSFSNTYTLFQGSESSLMMKENRSWMVKEADSSLLGWEVYARKESVYDETGICMIADATKLIQAGKEPGKDGPVEPTKAPLQVAFENFVKSVRDGSKPAAGAPEGYQSTVSAIKANEAVTSGKKIVFESGLFDLK
jgi:predicted dehydrogenase